jgi:NAD(P)-dependent dehydrogenase (short-subunit alcohol dehydrogenase family)
MEHEERRAADGMSGVSRESLFDLSGRCALVTGAARGLGRAMARALGRHGARLLLIDKDEATLRRTAASLEDEGLAVLALPGDVTRQEDSLQAVSLMQQTWGSVDICVNNAGGSLHVPAVEMTLEQWHSVLDLNLTGVFLVAQACGRQMIAQGHGVVINIASMSGLIANYPQPQCAYNASKAGVIMLTKSLASEWAHHGIRVNAIAPGYVRTERTATYFQNAAMAQQWFELTPLGRPGEPSELEGAAIYLASDASSFMTGQVLVIDGGYTAR